MNTNLVFMGTRNRPHNAVRAFAQLKEVSVESDFLMIINEDQAELYPDIDGVMKEIVPSDLGSVGKGNYVVHKYWDDYQTFAGIDDDCMVTTPSWDALLSAPIKERGFGVSYGNDTIQGEILPTKVMISTNIVKALGFFAPPVLKHLYADNFWKAMGQDLGALKYFPDVLVEHWHHINGKAPMDENYSTIYGPGENDAAYEAFNKYMNEQFRADMDRVNAAVLGRK